MHTRTREAPVYLVDAPVQARHLGVKVCILLGEHRTRLSLSHLLPDPPVSDPLKNVGAGSSMGAILRSTAATARAATRLSPQQPLMRHSAMKAFK